MNHKYRKSVRAGAIGVLALTMGVVGCVQANVTADSSLTAETASAVNVASIDKMSLTSGVSNVLTDFDYEKSLQKLAVAQSTADVVANGQSQVDDSICGYQNLGVAGVDDTLNIRESASTDSSVVGKMTKNSACEILGTEGEWTQITSGSVNGYVKSEFLLTGDAARDIANSEKKMMAIANTDGLRVRETPSTEATVVARVGNGEKLIALSEVVDGWVQVEIDDVQGYVYAEYVGLEEQLPTAQSMKELQYGSGVSNTRVDLVSYACQFVGNPYVWGGTSLTKGADCSGFTMSVFAKYGIYLPHSSRSQPYSGTIISASEAKPGDLFFYGSGKSISHVAIYIGNGQIVHASNERTGIIISNAFYRNPICLSRVLGE